MDRGTAPCDRELRHARGGRGGAPDGSAGLPRQGLALADARFEAALRRRPVLAGTIWAAATALVWVAIGVAICVAGGLFDVGYAVNVLPYLAIISVIFFGVRMWHVLRKLPAGGVATWRGLPLEQPKGFRLIAIRDWLGFIFFMGYVLLTDPMSFTGLTAAWFGDPDENWSRYLSGLWTSTGITLVLIVVTSNSLR